MDIGHMQMGMRLFFMKMHMVMFSLNRKIMSMAVMAIVMAVTVFMLKCRVNVAVPVIFKYSKICADNHYDKPKYEGNSGKFPKYNKGQSDADKWSKSIESAGSRCTKVTLCQNVKIDTKTICDKS